MRSDINLWVTITHKDNIPDAKMLAKLASAGLSNLLNGTFSEDVKVEATVQSAMIERARGERTSIQTA